MKPRPHIAIITERTLRSGCRAYVDSFVGLVPCRVLAIRGISGIASSSQDIDVVLTATRGAYKKGERLTWRALSHLCCA